MAGLRLRAVRWASPVGLVLAVGLIGGWRAVGAAPQAPQSQAADRVDVLVLFRSAPGASDDALVRGLGGRIKYTYRIAPAMAANLPAAAVAALQNNPRVAVVEPDAEVFAIGVSQDPDYAGELANTWGVARIGAGVAHEAGIRGLGVNVAVIDTGITYTHPDLAANYAGGWDFVNAYYGSATGTTDINGLVTLTFANISTGTYATVVTSVSAPGLTWDQATPPNSFVK